jgi:cytochrome c oxidase subunit 3
MDIGTIEPTVESGKPRPRRTSVIGGGGSGNGNAGRGGGGGDRPEEDLDNISTPSKVRVFTWFLLAVVLMTFGGLSAAYIMTATNGAIEWRPFALPVQVWISTVIILISSAVYHRGKLALDDYDQPRAKKWLVATTVLGAAFISSQMLAWIELSQRGLYFSGNPYAGFFYILTGLHAIHVLGGIIALGSVVIGSWNEIHSEQRWYRVRSLGEVVGWYWHFMGGVWVVLFLLLGFWQ